ncbi:DNA-directed RNA polymerase subunit beta [bacterium]|nr:DNA-directed RNA polymerase subunit beta [bacterium]
MEKPKKIKRKNYGKIKNVFDLPNLLKVPIEAYDRFLQKNISPGKRKKQGLEEIFREFSPIEDINRKYSLEYVSYRIDRPRFSMDECQTLNVTYSGALRVKYRLIEWAGETEEERHIKEAREGEVYLGEIPLMTEYGTFMVNGAERVVVNQLHRSPGVTFSEEGRQAKKKLPSAKVIPFQGTWIRFKMSARDIIYVYIRANQKVPVTTLLRATGFCSTDTEVLSLFHEIHTLKVTPSNKKRIIGKFAAETIVNEENGTIILETGKQISEEDYHALKKIEVQSINTVHLDIPQEVPIIFNTISADESKSTEEAQKHLFSQIRPTGAADESAVAEVVDRYIFNPDRYNLGEIGRVKLNERLGLNVPLDIHTLTPEDITEITRRMIEYRHGRRSEIDDIDHLGIRRVRTVDELLANQLRIGFTRMTRTVKQRMRTRENEKLSPSDLINPRTISAAINSFFGTGQLSQFMDQHNPLAGLTHKRRLSALGPGGLTRERAGFEVRDVHYTHYGRLCPIETPEGQNIGLITSICSYCDLDKYGFVETPYRVVKNGKVTDKIQYLTSDVEDNYIIGQANAPVNDKNEIATELILARNKSDVELISPKKIDYMDVSPLQMVGVSAGLIPFLEHDDANRALMGSNMQRQAVPLLNPQPPIIGTGLEAKVAADSGATVMAKRDGKVTYVTATKIIIEPTKTKSKNLIDLGKPDVYHLTKFKRTNQDTCINQTPLVKLGDIVKKDDTIADGPATSSGDLALGRNILVAFMPWRGYNYEDAIIVSEKLLREDVYTSIHIKQFEIQVRDTKRGPEELTREIPNVSIDAVKDLDEKGIIRIGAEIESGDILVGKVTPKGKTEYTPEERLLKAIFGEKAGDVKDASLRVPSGIKGIVINTVLLSRKRKSPENDEHEQEEIRSLEEQYKIELQEIKQVRDDKLKEFINGKRAQDLISINSKEHLVEPGQIITPEIIETLDFEDISPDCTWTDDAKSNLRIQNILEEVYTKLDWKEKKLNVEIDKIIRGDELPPGVIQLVKVDIAMKRKISVGDKMAGRHGNKGVISNIVPVEDMPYLEDGTPVDMILNPLGVPSRMNIGQILETCLGWAADKMGYYVSSPVFNGATILEIKEALKEAGLPPSGKVKLYDGYTGTPFESEITVGIIYMMKLAHLAEDKIHARSIGSYSLITQQPLGGKAQFGGQRFGEMEVWALEAYGAAYTLQEILTVKSDDVFGRSKMYESIVKGENPAEPGIPSAFNVMMNELRSLGLDVQLIKIEEE